MMAQWEFKRSSLVEGLNKWKLIKETENNRANSRLFASYLTGSSGAMKCNQGERERGAVMKRMLLQTEVHL